MEQFYQFIESILPSLMVGVVLSLWEKKQKTIDDQRRTENAIRKEREILQLDLLFASSELSYETAMALKRGNANGELENALKLHQEALSRFRNFEREHTVDI